jgi:valyl-tRNA synthetase
MLAPYPTFGEETIDPKAERGMELVKETVRAIRNARVMYHIEPAKWIEAIVIVSEMKPVFESQSEAIKTLARVQPLVILGAGGERPMPGEAKALVLEGAEVFLPLAGIFDLEVEGERLSRELEGSRAELARLEEKLNDEQFLTKAPPHVIERERERLQRHREKLGKLEKQLDELSLR